MDFLEMFTNQDQFKSEGFEEQKYIKKELKDGENSFRIVGRGKIYFTHDFYAANGAKVRSICTKDEDGNGECPVCKIWSGAWKLLNEVKKAEEQGGEHQYSPQHVDQARIVVGEVCHPKAKFKQSWGAKKRIAMNVIDRDTSTNRKENHTSLLVKNEYDIGITAGKRSIYETMVKLLARNKDELKKHYSKGHDWMPFDITMIREGKGIDTTYDKELGKSYELTKEELALERYDLNAITKPTDVKMVERWLKEGTKGGSKENSSLEDLANKADEDDDTDLLPPKEEVKVESKTEKVKEPEQDNSKATKFKKKEEPKPEPEPEVEDTTQEEMDNCPTCDALIPVTSTKCLHCGEEFEGYDGESKPF